MKPRLLDLFAGEGGAAYGYMLAGFDVTAVDDQERPGRAPGITWVTGDATTYPLDGYDVVAGSPPCTDHTAMAGVAEAIRGGGTGTGWMLQHTIDRFVASGLPWVVENVEGAKHSMPNPMKLCGSMFDLTDGGWLLRRHRYFSSSAWLMAPGPCRCHRRRVIGVYGDLSASDRRCVSLERSATQPRPNGDMRAGVGRARRLMGMPWASATGLPLAIPPAYTRYIGELLMDQLRAVAA